MKKDKIIAFTDLFSLTDVDSSLHAYIGYSKNKSPFKTETSNMVWKKDPSVDKFLQQGADGSWAHDCCALDTTRGATTEEIITGLGGIEKVSKHLYAYRNIEQKVGNSPSYRRWFGKYLSDIKEEMNLFFTLGHAKNLCAVGVSFGPFPHHQYSVFVREAFPPLEKSLVQKTFFQKFFTQKEKVIPEPKWPKGTRVFLIGDRSEIFGLTKVQKPTPITERNTRTLES